MDRKEENPIPSSATPGQAIPHHWWYDKPRDQSNSPGGLFGSSPTTSGYSSSPNTRERASDPHKPIPLPSATDWNWWQRRTSLFDDFATD
jgi:hypothetical protein